MKLTEKLQKAINIAAEFHDGKTRKGTKGINGNELPYILHPYSVAIVLSDYTDDENIIVAGILHDILEDATGYSDKDMVKDFGKNITDIVRGVTEDKDPMDNKETAKATWEKRKIQYVEKLKNGSTEALMVSCADKIHNLNSMIEVYRDQNPDADFFEPFNAPEPKRESTFNFYASVLSVLKERLNHQIVNEYEQVLKKAKTEIL